jgi:hypothetical protein
MLDLIALAARAAVLPQRTADPRLARELLERHGAAVITDLDTSAASAAGLAELVLGEHLVAAGKPIEVTDGGGLDRRRTADASRRMLPLHTDGYAYGAQAPDIFFLLCATPSPNDGLSFLVDQEALLDALAADSAGAELADFVRTHPVDQSEPGGIEAIGPIALALPSGRRAVRRSLDVRPADGDENPARTDRLLTMWSGLLDAVGALAQRFPVGAGEAVAIDNTRIAHGRDAYTSDGRSLWRCWAWTKAAGGVPEGELWSDTRAVLNLQAR